MRPSGNHNRISPQLALGAIEFETPGLDCSKCKSVTDGAAAGRGSQTGVI